MVVDTSEEIAGGGNIPHACIGTARRMLGSANQSKHQVMQEAVANHGPGVKLAATNAVSSCTSLATSVIWCTIHLLSSRAECAKPCLCLLCIQLHRQSAAAVKPSNCQSTPALCYSSSCCYAPALFIKQIRHQMQLHGISRQYRYHHDNECSCQAVHLQVVVVDEIANAKEVAALKDISQGG